MARLLRLIGGFRESHKAALILDRSVAKDRDVCRQLDAAGYKSPRKCGLNADALHGKIVVPISLPKKRKRSSRVVSLPGPKRRR